MATVSSTNNNGRLTAESLAALQRASAVSSNHGGGGGHSANPYGSLTTPNHAGAGGSGEAMYLTPDAGAHIISELLKQLYREERWQVPFPQAHKSPLLHVPPVLKESMAFPSEPLTSDLDAMALGLAESIPLTHYLMYPEVERALAENSRAVDNKIAAAAAEGLHAPILSPQELNPHLSAEDLALIDVDFFAGEHGQRNLPSLSFLLRPSYTEIGLTPAERRRQQRRDAIAARIQQSTGAGASGANNSSLTPNLDTAPSAIRLPTPSAEGFGAGPAALSSHEREMVQKWKETTSRTFKHARHLDTSFSTLLQRIATAKLGLWPEDAKHGAAAVTATGNLLQLLSAITANGVVSGATKNDSNNQDRFAYNDLQARFVAAVVWKHICLLAAKHWARVMDLHGPFDADAWVGQVAAESRIEAIFIGGASEPRRAILAELRSWVATYQPLLVAAVLAGMPADAAASAVGEEDKKDPLIHTPHDTTVPTVIVDKMLPVAARALPADVMALAVKPPALTEEELATLRQPLRLASGLLDLPGCFAHLSTKQKKKKSDANQHHNKAGGGENGTDADKAGEAADDESAGGPIPLAVYPVFPHDYSRLADADVLGCPSSTELGYALPNADWQHVIVNGEGNAFTSGMYLPPARRVPRVLLNDSVYFEPIVEEIEARKMLPAATAGSGGAGGGEGDHESGALETGEPPAIKKRRFEDGCATAYRTSNVGGRYLKYLTEPHSSTASYVLELRRDGTDDGDDSGRRNTSSGALSFNGPHVVYTRVPTYSRYRRAEARTDTDAHTRSVTIVWSGDEQAAAAEQAAVQQLVASSPAENAATTVTTSASTNMVPATLPVN